MMSLNSANVQLNNELHQTRNENLGLKQHTDNLARECANYKNQGEQNNKYMRDYSIQNGELQKKNLELSNVLKAQEAETMRLKTQIESLSKQATQQADYQNLKSNNDALMRVLAETKQEAITYKKECDIKDKDLSKHRVEVDRLNKEVLILQKSKEVLSQQHNDNSKVKKKNSEDKDLHRELQSVKKDLEAARRANSKLEKDLIDINNAKEKVDIVDSIFFLLLCIQYTSVSLQQYVCMFSP